MFKLKLPGGCREDLLDAAGRAEAERKLVEWEPRARRRVVEKLSEDLLARLLAVDLEMFMLQP